MKMSFLSHALYQEASMCPENRDELQPELDNTISLRFIPIFGANIKNIYGAYRKKTSPCSMQKKTSPCYAKGFFHL